MNLTFIYFFIYFGMIAHFFVALIIYLKKTFYYFKYYNKKTNPDISTVFFNSLFWELILFLSMTCIDWRM